GYISEYAILTADHGSLELSPFLGEVGSLPSLPLSKVPAPSAEFAEMYDRFGGASFWPNINMTPDVPTAGSLIETLYRKVRGVRLDGVIFLDPGALADMLGATGPEHVSALGRTLSADDVVPYLTNRVYFQEPNRNIRKEAVGLAAGEIWRHFLQEAEPIPAVHALTAAVRGGDLLIHAADPTVQRDFERLGVTGDLGADRGQFLGVVLSNADA